MSVTGESISVDPKKIGIVSKPKFFFRIVTENDILQKTIFLSKNFFFADHPKTIQQKSGALMDEIWWGTNPTENLQACKTCGGYL